MKSHVTDYALYRWRYKIGYSLIFLIVVVILGLTSIYIPGSLREAELSSALESGALSAQSLDPATVVNLPYHILQRLGFMVFGVSTLTIKLPSIILGALTSVGVCLLTRAWFRRNVAVLATSPRGNDYTIPILDSGWHTSYFIYVCHYMASNSWNLRNTKRYI